MVAAGGVVGQPDPVMVPSGGIVIAGLGFQTPAGDSTMLMGFLVITTVHANTRNGAKPDQISMPMPPEPGWIVPVPPVPRFTSMKSAPRTFAVPPKGGMLGQLTVPIRALLIRVVPGFVIANEPVVHDVPPFTPIVAVAADAALAPMAPIARTATIAMNIILIRFKRFLSFVARWARF